MLERVLLLGESHSEHGVVHRSELNGIEVALSAGANPRSPSQANKRAANEDGILVMVDHNWALVAVADAHFGPQASHTVLERLQQRCERIPTSLGSLSILLAGLAEPSQSGPSATTLTVAVVDRSQLQCFGMNFGDSSLFSINQQRCRKLTQDTTVYLSLERAVPIELAETFRVSFEGSTLMACTDGVTECHYRSPATSINHDHLLQLRRQAEHLGDFVDQVSQLAMKGVDGNPGGQDNLAIVALEGTRAEQA